MSVEVINLVKEYKKLAKTKTFSLKIKSFIKRDYKRTRAVDDVKIKINPGEKVTILGPNGAGKSSIIKILTGIIQPTDGTASVCGFNPQKDRYNASANFGVVFGHRSLLWKHIPVKESLKLYRDVYEIPHKIYKKRLSDFTELLEIGEFLDRQPRKLSLGERMRCELAASLLHNPPVVFLDEPTIGLDLVAAKRIRKFINDRNKEDGVTVVLCSHNVKDIEQICDRAILLMKGKTLYDGPTKDLSSILRREKQLKFSFRIVEKKPIDLKIFLQKLIQKKKIKVTEDLEKIFTLMNGAVTAITLEFNSDDVDIDFLIHNLMNLVDRIVDIEITDADLEDVISELYLKGKDVIA